MKNKVKKIRHVISLVLICTIMSNGIVCATTVDVENGSVEESEERNQEEIDNSNQSETEENSEESMEEDNSELNGGEEVQEEETENTLFVGAGVDAPYDLKVNLLSEPYGITKNQMSFSWIDSFENEMSDQTAYRIVISKRMEDVYDGSYIYDSGWVESKKNTSVLYDLTNELQDNELYYWQVQTKNISQQESSFSEPQAFTTAVGNEWISKKGTWGTSSEKIVFYRTEIEKNQEVEKAVISITATSAKEARQYVYNLYVNDKEVGIGPVRQNGSNLYYDSYDITEYLAEGKNVIGAINYSEADAGFLCQIAYFMTDGSQKIVSNSTINNKEWKVLDGDNIYIGNDKGSIGTNYYTAKKDNINANLYPDGWLNNGYQTGAWKTPNITSSLNSYQFAPSQIDHMKRYEVEPASVKRISAGTYLIDMGKEIIGSIRLNLQSSGRVISLKYGEELNEDGTVRYKMRTRNVYDESWTLKNGSQSLSGISMKTYRYVCISNLPDGFDVNNVTGLMIRTEFDENASDFNSSNTILNDAYNLSKYTSKATTQDLYVDSQNRERLPYEGDALITALNSYSYSDTSTSAKATAEYLLTNTTWPAEYSLHNISLIYLNYLYTGDKRGLEESYELLKKKTLESYYDSSVGLMRDVKDGKLLLAGYQRVMTDWPTMDLDGYKTGEAYYNTVFNAICAGAYADMAKLAEVLGYEGDRAYYQNLSDTIKNTLISKVYDSQTGRFYDGLTIQGEVVAHAAQHATAYALAYKIYDNQEMADKMCASIESDGEVKMSLYGTYYLLRGLYDSNYGDLARKIISNPDDELGSKSWAYMMYGQNATITTEYWNDISKSSMSKAHAWGASPGIMMVQGMFGIKPTSPGFDTFDVKMQPGGISNASVRVPTLKGEISASYQLDSAGNVSGQISVPSNSTATVYIPYNNESSSVYIDGQLTDVEKIDNYLSFQLSAGIHSYESSSGMLIDESEWLEEDVVYSAYRDGNWTEETTNRTDIRNDKSAMIEAVRLRIKNQSVSGDIQYSAFVQNYGWQNWVGSGKDAGIPGSGKRMEAFCAQLTGDLNDKYDIYYKTYVEGEGWLDWASNGEPAGSSGYSKKILKIQATLVKKGETPPGNTRRAYISKEKNVSYQTHVQNYGWQPECGDGETSGSVGSSKRLEAIKIELKNSINGGISYCTHVQTYGWQDWKSNGELAGTSGEGKRLEAIKIKLTGEVAEQYDIYYRVHAQTFGWLGWTKNGESAGTEGYGKRLEAIEIKLVKKGNAAPGDTSDSFRKALLGYSTHVQNYGWQSYVYDGELSGTSGESKRLEAIRIQNSNVDVSGSVLYRTHVQNYGWENKWKCDGELSGTSGEGKRLEAIQIRLEGDLQKKYDIYYRVHAQSIGWLDWAKNGESAGTEGLSRRLEAIQIVYVEKDGKAPGSTRCPFVGQERKIAYRTHVQTYGWQGYKYDGLMSGTSGESKRLEAIDIHLEDKSIPGEVRYKTHVQTYGWQSWVTDGQLSGTSGESKRLEAIQIELTGKIAGKYDIYYRVHAQTYGWLGWAKNGESAGTEGLSKRLEGIQIVLVEKGGEAPGKTGGALIK